MMTSVWQGPTVFQEEIRPGYKKNLHNVLMCAKDFRMMTSVWQGSPFSGDTARELWFFQNPRFRRRKNGGGGYRKTNLSDELTWCPHVNNSKTCTERAQEAEEHDPCSYCRVLTLLFWRDA